jgi:hypothetical protein
MSKNEVNELLNKPIDFEFRSIISMLFHNIVVEGKNYFLNLSVLTPKGEKSKAFLKDRPDLCCTV